MPTAIAAPVSAAKPLTGCSFVIRDPIVWMMRQPPNSVPSEMAAYAAISTQNGMWNVSMYPAVSSTPAMIPIVFWASFAPCVRLKNPADTQLQPPEPLVHARGRRPPA